ncbi:serine/threonine protein kinase [Cylindrospermum sp. NIES-4074]|nr:serine/threonine protein kinase [Cylindrospermum sp. NIES-4074]
MTWAIGQVLKGGDYLIEQILGRGGFGITYRALQVKLNRQVVIKTPDEYLHYDPEYDKYSNGHIG